MNIVWILCCLLRTLLRRHIGHITHYWVRLHSQGAIIPLLIVAFAYHHFLNWIPSQWFLEDFSSFWVAHTIAHQIWDAYRWFRRAEEPLLIHVGRSDTEWGERLVGGIERIKLKRGIPYLLTSFHNCIKWQSCLWRIVGIDGGYRRQDSFFCAWILTLGRPIVLIHLFPNLILNSLGKACATDWIWQLDSLEYTHCGTLLLDGIVPFNRKTLTLLLMHHRHLVCETSHLVKRFKNIYN